MEPRAWDAIGTIIKRTRERQGLSQTELANRSGVNISSVFRVEKGKSIRISTVAKISKGLDIVLDSVLNNHELPPELARVVVHRAANASWFAEEDRRTVIPNDHMSSYQDPDERRRLGRLSFVSWFMEGPTGVMKSGPGVVPLEIHGLGYGAFNSKFYEDAVLYVIRGKVSVLVGTDKVDLKEADWVGFKSAELISIAPADPESQSVALVLWIGANRISRRKRRFD